MTNIAGLFTLTCLDDTMFLGLHDVYCKIVYLIVIYHTLSPGFHDAYCKIVYVVSKWSHNASWISWSIVQYGFL